MCEQQPCPTNQHCHHDKSRGKGRTRTHNTQHHTTALHVHRRRRKKGLPGQVSGQGEADATRRRNGREKACTDFDKMGLGTWKKATLDVALMRKTAATRPLGPHHVGEDVLYTPTRTYPKGAVSLLGQQANLLDQ